MSNIKGFLYIVLGILLVILFQSVYRNEVQKQSDISTAQQEQPQTTMHTDRGTPDIVSFSNESMNVLIDLNGGKIIQTQIKGHYQTEQQKSLVELFNYNKELEYFAVSGFQGDEGLTFKVVSKESDRIVIEARSNNIVYTRTFSFGSTPFTLKQENNIKNASFSPITTRPYLAMLSNRTNSSDIAVKSFQPGSDESASSGWFMIPTYSGVTYYSPEKPYTKLPYTEIQKGFAPKKLTGGWFGIQQRYFINAWVPDSQSQNILQTHWSGFDTGEENHFVVQMIGQEQTLGVDNEIQTQQRLYSGPEIEHILEQVSPGLDLTIDYGWLWLLSHWLFWLMSKINIVVQNWGITIIVITALIKGVFYKMSEKAFISSLKMKKLQPRIKDIQERFADDAAKKSKAIMEIYQKEKINPLGGCLPILIQFPFLIALYWVLIESVQLRQASFLWITDLSQFDPLYILPIIMGVGMYLQQKVTPTTMDPDQEKAMMVVPFVMVFLFSHFPAGLALYMLTNALLTALQQWYLTRKFG